MRVSHQGNRIEFAWGPLSGFGGTDLTRLTGEITFDYCDVYFRSIVDAAVYAMEKLDSTTYSGG